MTKVFVQMAVLVIAVATAFYVGMLWQQSGHVSSKPGPSHTAALPASPMSPLERLQLNASCAVSAQAYFNEEKMSLFDHEEYEHGYNYRLNQCFVLISSFMNAGHGSDHSMTWIMLYDAITGKEYGDFRKTYGPVNGVSQETLTKCAMFEDGGDVMKKCISQDGWDAYTKYMMHDWL